MFLLLIVNIIFDSYFHVCITSCYMNINCLGLEFDFNLLLIELIFEKEIFWGK